MKLVEKAEWGVLGMTLEECAEALRVDRKTIFKMLQEEGLPARKVGVGWRIDPDAVKAWLATGNANAEATDAKDDTL